MSIFESIIYGFLFGSVYKLLYITKNHKQRIEKLEGKHEVID